MIEPTCAPRATAATSPRHPDRRRVPDLRTLRVRSSHRARQSTRSTRPRPTSTHRPDRARRAGRASAAARGRAAASSTTSVRRRPGQIDRRPCDSGTRGSASGGALGRPSGPAAPRSTAPPPGPPRATCSIAPRSAGSDVLPGPRSTSSELISADPRRLLGLWRYCREIDLVREVQRRDAPQPTSPCRGCCTTRAPRSPSDAVAPICCGAAPRRAGACSPRAAIRAGAARPRRRRSAASWRWPLRCSTAVPTAPPARRRPGPRTSACACPRSARCAWAAPACSPGRRAAIDDRASRRAGGRRAPVPAGRSRRGAAPSSEPVILAILDGRPVHRYTPAQFRPRAP